MVRAAKLDVEFTTSGVNTVNHAVDSVNLKLGAIGAGLMLTGQQLTNNVTRPIVGFLWDAYTGAASLEQAMGKVEAVYQDSADEALRWSENSAMGFGQSKKDALDMVGTYGQIMQAQGMAREESLLYSQGLVELAADMSAFTDISIDRSNLALRSALTGEYQSLKQFGIVLKAADVELEAHNIALENGTDEVTEYHRQLARMRIIQLQTSTMTGQFAREADGASGSLAILNAQWDDMKTQLGDILLPIGTKVTGMLSSMISGFSKLPAPITTSIVVVAALAAAIGPLLTVVGMMAVGIAALPAAFAAIAAGATAFMAALVSLLPVIGAVALASAALFAAYKTNFLGFGNLVDGALGKARGFFDYLFGTPESKTVTFGVDSYTDTGFDDWQLQADGDYKHATLDVEATGSGPGFISKVENPDSPDGWDYTLNVDVDGDGASDALNIISSVDEGGGTYKFKVDLDGQEYYAWYDEATGQTIFIKAEVDLNTDVAERKSGTMRRQWSDITHWLGDAYGILRDIFNGDWGNIDWDETLGISRLRDDFQEIYDLVEGIFGFFKNDVGSKSPKQDDYGLTRDDISNWGVNNVLYDKNIPSAGGSNYADPYRPIDGGGVSVEPSTIDAHIERLQLWEAAARNAFAAMAPLPDALGKTGAAAVATNPAFQALQSVMGTSASTATGFSGTMQTTASTTGAAGASLGSTFQGIAASAMARFSEARSAASSQFNSLQSIVTSQASEMNTAVTGKFMGMKTAAALQMALMASTASTSGAQMSTGLTGWMAGAQTRIAVGLALMMASVRNAGGSGYSAGYYAGSMIGSGMAAGMYAYLGSISAAANAMVDAASRAVVARAMISSPSRLFKQYGAYMGEGMELGILGKVADVGRAADRLIEASLPTPALNTPIHGGGQVVHHHTYKTEVFTLTSEEWLARQDEIADRATAQSARLFRETGDLVGGMGN